MWRAVCWPRPHSQWGDSNSETFRVRRNFFGPIFLVCIYVSKALSLLLFLRWSFKNFLPSFWARLYNSCPLMFYSYRWVHFLKMFFQTPRFTVPTGLGSLGFPEGYECPSVSIFHDGFLSSSSRWLPLPLFLPFPCFLFPHEPGSTQGELWSRRFSVRLQVTEGTRQISRSEGKEAVHPCVLATRSNSKKGEIGIRGWSRENS